MDYTSGRPYYVVIAPSVSRRFGKAFFAGVKKMPRDPKKKAYAPTGKYFATLAAALRHAKEMWGTPWPDDAAQYNKQDLMAVEIPRHIKV